MGIVAGLFASRDEAQRAVEALSRAGIRPEDVGLVVRHPGEMIDEEARTGFGESSAVAAAGGGILGGLTGLVAGLGALSVPGIGPVLAAGPIAATIAGAAIGVGAGGIVGSLVDMGVSEDEAKRLHAGIERGHVLVTARVPHGREDEAKKILEREGMTDEAGPDEVAGLAADPRYDDGRDDWARGPDPVNAAGHEGHRPPVDESDGLLLAGGATGSVIGGVIGGLVAGPVGAVAGVALGALAGGATGAAYEYSAVEPSLREVWERSEYRESITWDRATNAFRYGWESHDRPELSGEHWDDVAPTLRGGWPAESNWQEHEPLVRVAWQHRKQTAGTVGGTVGRIGSTDPAPTSPEVE